MSRKRSVMSDNLKMEIAKELGFYERVRSEGDFGNVSSRDCGNMVKAAIQLADKKVMSRYP